MIPVRSSLMCALTRLVSRNAEATNIDVAAGATFVKPNDRCRLQTATDAVCCTLAQADGFNERQLFTRCNPTILRRRPLSLMDSAEVG